MRAPEINLPGLEWLNVDRPLSLEDLRGRLVILDFWTFCCINCYHILPTLRRVEQAYPDQVAVIGIHSPKFEAEKDLEKLAAALERYDVRHPVIQDIDHRLWDHYTVKAWPTLVLLSPDGQIITQFSGEPEPDRFVEAIGNLLSENLSEAKPNDFPWHSPAVEDKPLHFPGKIKPFGEDRWIIADSGHHQILLCDDAGAVLQRIGAGQPGIIDGPFAEARFNHPQGLIGDAEAGLIYVADTNNHMIRKIDLNQGSVITLAGTGFRGQALPEEAEALTTDLASPWDLEREDDTLYFANAGSHQLGYLALGNDSVHLLAGTGQENIIDGPAELADLAQPSGLALSPDGYHLYFADSETSALRQVKMGFDNHIQTLVGKGLFHFGYQDGELGEALLQHALGVTWHDQGLLIADSYNDSLRYLHLAAQQTVTWEGMDYTCLDPVCRPLSEPAGVYSLGDTVMVADTNNHRILRYDRQAKTYQTWLGA